MLNKTKIEWCDFTFNPVVGCKHGCSYCYAKRMNDRFKWIPKWNEPKFYPERCNDKMPDKPSKIFVGSMCDLFGDWINAEWIFMTLRVARENPQHTFQFLTKNPKRYLEFDFPKNCWLGTTIDGTEKAGIRKSRIDWLTDKHNYKFVSIEPLLGDVSDVDLSGVNLVIVGAMTGRGAIPPQEEWIKSIAHKNIFWKSNIKKYLL